MAKAMLVMDMPKKCLDCYMCYFSPDEDDLVCADTKFPIETFMGIRPDWCPLIPARGYIDANGNLISWEDDGDE